MTSAAPTCWRTAHSRSTSLPDSTRRVAQAIAAKGGKFLDAAMTGTPKHADEGKLNLLVEGAIRRC